MSELAVLGVSSSFTTVHQSALEVAMMSPGLQKNICHKDGEKGIFSAPDESTFGALLSLSGSGHNKLQCVFVTQCNSVAY